MPTLLTPERLVRDLTIRDLTDPEAGPHAIQMVLAAAVSALAGAWNCPVQWHRGTRIVSVVDNYDLLGFSPADTTRDSRYTRYIANDRMLRSHSSAMIPAALRSLAANPQGPDDVLIVAPGIVYRRDSIDRLHTGTPHQVDLWRLRRGRSVLGRVDLTDMIGRIAGAVLPGAMIRTEARTHPYMLDGMQVDVDRGGKWVEAAECAWRTRTSCPAPA